jgi:hypothetical protein
MITANGNIVATPLVEKDKNLEREVLNLFIAFIGWLFLTLAMIGSGKILLEYLFLNSFSTGAALWAKIIMLALSALVGWGVTLVSIRKLHNFILPLIVCGYAILVVLGMLFLYFYAVYHIFTARELSFFDYFIVFFLGYLAIVGLHLLLEDLDLRLMTIPLVLAILTHLLFGVIYYVFMKPAKPECVNYDLFLLGVMVFIIWLLLSTNLYRPFRRMIAIMFPPKISMR